VVRREDLHVTLVFLGWREPGLVARLWKAASSATSAVAETARLEPAAVMPVPKRRPRLLALDLRDHGGVATNLYAAVAGTLEDEGLYEREQRPFWPHVTLARVRKGGRAPRRVAQPRMAAFAPEALVLYRSELSREGARYTALERHPLV
jgi:RNA 2',3'-cyclic 3'-phosphodiesterase